MELETLNGVTREELLSRWDLTDENKPIWKDFEYLYRISASRLYGKEVGFVSDSGTRIVNVKGKTYHYEKVLNWIKYGFLGDDGEYIQHKYNLTDTEFYKLSARYNGITQRTKNNHRNNLYQFVRLHESFSTLDKFVAWCIKQVGYGYYINDTDNWHLDKDILGDENDKMYSANNCVLVPNELNVMAQTKKRNKHGKGVQYQPNKKNPYRAYINIDGKPIGLGYHSTAEDANAEYIKARQAQVNVLKERYKGMVDDRVWDGLMRGVFCK